MDKISQIMQNLFNDLVFSYPNEDISYQYMSDVSTFFFCIPDYLRYADAAIRLRDATNKKVFKIDPEVCIAFVTKDSLVTLDSPIQSHAGILDYPDMLPGANRFKEGEAIKLDYLSKASSSKNQKDCNIEEFENYSTKIPMAWAA